MMFVVLIYIFINYKYYALRLSFNGTYEFYRPIAYLGTYQPLGTLFVVSTYLHLYQ